MINLSKTVNVVVLTDESFILTPDKSEARQIWSGHRWGEALDEPF